MSMPDSSIARATFETPWATPFAMPSARPCSFQVHLENVPMPLNPHANFQILPNRS